MFAIEGKITDRLGFLWERNAHEGHAAHTAHHHGWGNRRVAAIQKIESLGINSHQALHIMNNIARSVFVPTQVGMILHQSCEQVW